MNPAAFGSPSASACALGPQGVHTPDRITRNAAGERVQLRDGVGAPDEAAEATWAYNLAGQVGTVIDGNGNRAELGYDGHGRQDRSMRSRPPIAILFQAHPRRSTTSLLAKWASIARRMPSAICAAALGRS